MVLGQCLFPTQVEAPGDTPAPRLTRTVLAIFGLCVSKWTRIKQVSPTSLWESGLEDLQVDSENCGG